MAKAWIIALGTLFVVVTTFVRHAVELDRAVDRARARDEAKRSGEAVGAKLQSRGSNDVDWNLVSASGSSSVTYFPSGAFAGATLVIEQRVSVDPKLRARLDIDDRGELRGLYCDEAHTRHCSCGGAIR